MFDAAHIYALDLETDTSGGGGLDPQTAGITECALTTGDGDTVLSAAGDETGMLIALDDTLAALPPGLIVTWNGTFFDLPFLRTRTSIRRRACDPAAKRLRDFGMQLIPQPDLHPRYDYLNGHACGYTAVWQRRDHRDAPHQHLDVSFAYRQVADALGVRSGLKPVARALGIEVIEVDRARMHLLTDAERIAYASSDTRATRELALRLLGAGGTSPLAATATPRS